MAIKIKNRTPKTTDFKKNDVVINITDGSLFYKSNRGLHKVATTTVVTSVAQDLQEAVSTIDLVDTNPSLTDQDVKDIVGSMFSDNTETNINAVYDSSAGVINLEVPTQEIVETEDGEVVTGTFYSIGLVDNNGLINSSNSDLMLAANHEESNGQIVESDKASIILKKDEAKTEINGDLVTVANTLDEGDNPVGIGKIETPPGANVTVGGNLRADKLIITDSNGDEYYLNYNPLWYALEAVPCPDGVCT